MDHKARSAIWRTATDLTPRNEWKSLAEAPWPCWKISGAWNSCARAANKHSAHDSARTKGIAPSWKLLPLRSAAEANLQSRLMRLCPPRWQPCEQQSRVLQDSLSN